MTDTPEDGPGPRSPASLIKAAALGECPRCAAPTMFRGAVQFADKCGQCGLDYSRFNVGDGPAGFLTLIVGAVMAILAIVVDQMLHPPFWVHVILWVPLTIAMVVYGLRLAKGALLIVEYRRGAREAQSRGDGGGE
ncbi:DUF983 domain-containing protein [uncultured Croceicoccus sp.]|uniref:DUF983 domain-containing protein n=1 Tax=uncultured Croceicoccus sp. TaxID=1295329 RepID=UPI002601604E|nr:DUF983 domain-containing protein [uncultured Croceicoccus sp.]